MAACPTEDTSHRRGLPEIVQVVVVVTLLTNDRMGYDRCHVGGVTQNGVRMRALLLVMVAGVLAIAATASGLESQERDTADAGESRDRALPREVALEVAALFNETTAMRVIGDVEIPQDRTIDGDVAVLDGSLTLAGRVTGRVLVLNGDATLAEGARIDGELIVVGGRVSGEEKAFIGGEIRVYRQPFHYHQEGDRIVADRADWTEERWPRRSRPRRFSSGPLKLQVGSLGVYTRVEGLPIYIGPSLRAEGERGRLTMRVHGVFRTADDFAWDSDNLGHRVDAEVRLGRRGGLALGGALYDVVDDVEDWQLSDLETGLASFFLHRDYRDYYNRHGGRGNVALFLGEQADLTFSLSDERWRAREDRDPFTLFRNGQRWRPNPEMDEGAFHIANATLRIDTRNDEDNPWAGWFITADIEHGSGDVTRYAPTTTLRATPSDVDYTRGFLDLRRYNRIGPSSQLNARLVLGGWLDGDQLPLQRRFSVGGPGTLPGFDFRQAYELDDRGTCMAAGLALPGRPAECERVALAQLEYRGEIDFDFFGSGDWYRWRMDTDGQWIVFADAGRGWLVGAREGDLRYPKGDIPPLGTFRTDAGIGFDFGLIGVYVAKSISEPKVPANVFIRVHHRF